MCIFFALRDAHFGLFLRLHVQIPHVQLHSQGSFEVSFYLFSTCNTPLNSPTQPEHGAQLDFRPKVAVWLRHTGSSLIVPRCWYLLTKLTTSERGPLHSVAAL
jgi:hypothetical protein